MRVLQAIVTTRLVCQLLAPGSQVLPSNTCGRTSEVITQSACVHSVYDLGQLHTTAQWRSEAELSWQGLPLKNPHGPVASFRSPLTSAAGLLWMAEQTDLGSGMPGLMAPMLPRPCPAASHLSHHLVCAELSLVHRECMKRQKLSTLAHASPLTGSLHAGSHATGSEGALAESRSLQQHRSSLQGQSTGAVWRLLTTEYSSMMARVG